MEKVNQKIKVRSGHRRHGRSGKSLSLRALSEGSASSASGLKRLQGFEDVLSAQMKETGPKDESPEDAGPVLPIFSLDVTRMLV